MFCLHSARLRAEPRAFFSWLHASGGDPDRVTRQIVGIYIAEFARGARQGAISAHSAKKPRQPRTINHRLSVLASYFEYCILRDTEAGRGPWKGCINPASGNPLPEELRHGMIGRDLPARQRQRDGFRRRIPRTLPKILEPAAIQKLIHSAGSYRDKAILILLSRAGQRIGDWSPLAGRHGMFGHLGCAHARPKKSAVPIFRRMLASHERSLVAARGHSEPAGQIAAREMELVRIRGALRWAEELSDDVAAAIEALPSSLV